MKSILTSLLSTGAMVCMLLTGTSAFSQDDDFASSKEKATKDKMPVITPESHDSIPVIYQNIKDPMPAINPDTVSVITPRPTLNKQKKRVYKNNYNYPSYGSHFRDNRIGSMVGQSDTRRVQPKKQIAPL